MGDQWLLARRVGPFIVCWPPLVEKWKHLTKYGLSPFPCLGSFDPNLCIHRPLCIFTVLNCEFVQKSIFLNAPKIQNFFKLHPILKMKCAFSDQMCTKGSHNFYWKHLNLIPHAISKSIQCSEVLFSSSIRYVYSQYKSLFFCNIIDIKSYKINSDFEQRQYNYLHSSRNL